MKIINRTKYNVAPRTRTESIKYIVVHFLGVANADNPDLYDNGYGGHFYVARNGDIYNAVDPLKGVTWHCGGGLQGSKGGTLHGICTNNNSIGVEVGVNNPDKNPTDESPKWYFTKESTDSLIALTRYLMSTYNVPITNVVRHFDVTGKYCPAPFVTNNRYNGCITWEEFKADISPYKDFVNNVYATVLYRCPDSSGFVHYCNALNNGLTPSDFISILCLSDENAGRFISSTYRHLLRREPQTNEIDVWLSAIRNYDMTPFDFIKKIMKSTEYKSLKSTEK